MKRRISWVTYRLIALILTVGATLSLIGCGEEKERPRQWTGYEYFDTYTVFYDYSGDGEAVFTERRDKVRETLEYYHKLFDIYNSYGDVVGIAEINAKAGEGTVRVSEELFDFLEYCVYIHGVTDGAVNIAMGSVLSVWHKYRKEGTALPTQDELTEAALHCDITKMRLDRESLTVELTDGKMSLDVGAIGKGYAVEKAAEALKVLGADGCVIDGGGNLRAIGEKPDGSGWSTAILDPHKEDGGYAHRLELKNSSLATSGDYQRYYTVGGVKYHHIIDGETLMPAVGFSSVSVLCESAALADALSTALFIMSYEDGRTLVAALGVDALWITNDGEMLKTDGMG